jgi:hypothetical protein
LELHEVVRRRPAPEAYCDLSAAKVFVGVTVLDIVEANVHGRRTRRDMIADLKWNGVG